jgi:hypothetical protein
MPSPPAAPRRKYIDRPEIGEVFADGVERITFDGATLRMEFVVLRQDEQGGDLWAYTSARLVLSLSGVNDLIDKMDRLRATLRERAATQGEPAGRA